VPRVPPRKLIETTTDRAAPIVLSACPRYPALAEISEGLVDFARARKDVMESVALRPLIIDELGVWWLSTV